jgi:hypothetical protein
MIGLGVRRAGSAALGGLEQQSAGPVGHWGGKMTTGTTVGGRREHSGSTYEAVKGMVTG